MTASFGSIVGVEQQPPTVAMPGNPPIDNFARWKARGVNVLVNVPQWSENQAAQDAAWLAAANAAGLGQIRRPILTNPAAEAANPLLIALVLPDEIDRTGAMSIDAAIAEANRLRSTYRRPVFCNVCGGIFLGIQHGGPSDADYKRLFAACDWVAVDIYPVAGWNLNVPIDSVGRALDKLIALSPGKRHLSYLETGPQGMNQGGEFRGPSVLEWRYMRWQITSRKADVIYFPLRPMNGFAWDTTPTEIEWDMVQLGQPVQPAQPAKKTA